ncbi:MAG TPA: hypothetical protein VMW47_02790 [Verrucomicrobiae bacterium]|nr:hypothetical protein [Verrucomicrobiae bacterium]
MRRARVRQRPPAPAHDPAQQLPPTHPAGPGPAPGDRPPVPCHPLVAAAGPRRAVPGTPGSTAAALVGAVRVLLATSPRASLRRAAQGLLRRPPAVPVLGPARGGRGAGPRLLAEQGRPLIIAVGSGRGGSGRSTVAHSLAATLAHRPGAGPVLLIDQDYEAPDQDLRLRGDGHPTLADLLEALPVLAAGDGDLGQYLARDPVAGMHVLLAPAASEYRDAVGPEHLDYVLTYLLAPAFTAIVVDLDRGSSSGLATGASFWLPRADVVLVPFAGDPAGMRGARRFQQACLRWGVPPAAVWPILNGDRPGLQRSLGLEAQLATAARARLPWAPDPALRALTERRPLSLADRGMQVAYTGLAAALQDWAARRRAETE